MAPPERHSTPHATAHPAPLSGLPLGRPPHTLSTVIPAEAGIQVRPPAKNAAHPGPAAMADTAARASGRLSIPVETNLDPRLRGDDGGGGGATPARVGA